MDVEKNADALNPVSTKRPLPFSDVEIDENHQALSKSVAETESNSGEVSAKRSLLFSDVQDQLEKVECSDTMEPLQLEKVECSDTMKPPASSSKPCSDSIAGRLRSRLKKT